MGRGSASALQATRDRTATAKPCVMLAQPANSRAWPDLRRAATATLASTRPQQAPSLPARAPRAPAARTLLSQRRARAATAPDTHCRRRGAFLLQIAPASLDSLVRAPILRCPLCILASDNKIACLLLTTRSRTRSYPDDVSMPALSTFPCAPCRARRRAL